MKHAAIVAVAVWLAVMLWAGGLVLHADPSARLLVEPAAGNDNATAQADTLRARVALATIEPLRRAQSNAASLLPALLATAPAGAVGVVGAADAAASSDAGDAAEAAPARSVSMVYYAGDFRRAVIDGVYVRPGSRLRDGTRVVDIAADAVVLRDAQGRHRIKVDREATLSAPERASVIR